MLLVWRSEGGKGLNEIHSIEGSRLVQNHAAIIGPEDEKNCHRLGKDDREVCVMAENGGPVNRAPL